MKNKILAISVRCISNVCGTIELFDLYNNDGSFNYQPCLVFKEVQYDSTWDNSDYVLSFLRDIYKNKKSALKELKEFCKMNKLDFEESRRDLIDIYVTSKFLKFWKK